MAEARAEEGQRLDDYDYELPVERIALRPVEPRDAARLLVAPPAGQLEDHSVRDLRTLLQPGDRLVVNDSRVIPARLSGTRVRDGVAANIEATLIEQEASTRWRALAKPAKRLRPGDTIAFAGTQGSVKARVVSRDGGTILLDFSGEPLVAGAMPLPPYIAAKRAPDARDRDDYQTVYADPPGSVAAPTAGLHFTDALLGELRSAGVGLTRVTLHVGPGTFLPVTAEDLDAHEMHAERASLTSEAVEEIAATRQAGGRVVAVGTTTLRVLETAAAGGALAPFEGETQLFIRPGFQFRAADGLLTNFHLPRSTLLMLVAAFVGLPRMRAIYDHALEHEYRFYSYGDASLLWHR